MEACRQLTLTKLTQESIPAYLAMLDCMELMRENLNELDRKDRENGPIDHLDQ